MVLGSKAVDLPYDIRDSFIQVGWLMLCSLWISNFFDSWFGAGVKQASFSAAQVGCGVSALVIFLGLTGLQPPVLRAVVMGFGALIALAMRRKLTVGVTTDCSNALLLFNPLWIWDLGFQLSFLATLGLLVTVPPLTKQLDWLPLAILSLIAVPIAALWTLPCNSTSLA